MASASSHIEGRKALLEAWPKVTGETPSLAELQFAGAQATLESNYGKAQYTNNDTGQKSGVIHNWGAVQSGKPPCGPGGFEASDTHADGTKYTWCYKIYPNAAAGAAHLIEHMTVKRPTSWALMKKGDIDAWAEQMHSYKPVGSNVRNLDPITGTPGYFEQKPDSRAKGIETFIAEIAAAHNEPIAAKRGGPMTDGGSSPALPPTWKKPALIGGTIASLLALFFAWVRSR